VDTHRDENGHNNHKRTHDDGFSFPRNAEEWVSLLRLAGGTRTARGKKGKKQEAQRAKIQGGCRYLMVLILPPFSRAHNARIVVRTGASSSPSCIHIQLQRVNTYVNTVSGVSLSSSMRSMSFTTNAPGSASRYRERRVRDRWTNRIRTVSPIASRRG
jgi:hypothetical protein